MALGAFVVEGEGALFVFCNPEVRAGGAVELGFGMTRKSVSSDGIEDLMGCAVERAQVVRLVVGGSFGGESMVHVYTRARGKLPRVNNQSVGCTSFSSPTPVLCPWQPTEAPV